MGLGLDDSLYVGCPAEPANSRDLKLAEQAPRLTSPSLPGWDESAGRVGQPLGYLFGDVLELLALKFWQSRDGVFVALRQEMLHEWRLLNLLLGGSGHVEDALLLVLKY